MRELKPGYRVQLDHSNEIFTIDKVFSDGHVDMTATKPYAPELGLNFHESLYSILLINYKILED
jgi:hypothetical protein